MIVLMLLAAGIGLGLWALAVWLMPPRPHLSTLMSRLNTTPAPPPLLTISQGGWAVRTGAPFTGWLRALGLPTRSVRQDLAVAERSADTHLAEKAALALTGLLLPAALALVLVLGGRPLPWAVPLGGSLACAVGGFLLPDATVRAEADRRRTAFRHALSAYLGLIHILLAGGSGVDGALSDAVEVGQGWSFQQLRRALSTARLTRTSPWTTLGQLGDELDVSELSELAAALSLAGTEGAKVRASLAAKAAAMRSRSSTEAEGKANAATERMALPGMLMAFGFIIFVFYPALTQITTSL
ncbi:type II secretion system F family protein [Streptantibioticus ferralitis]|uniref:Type II secretion system F family protein n=1 Tax=Streptantibioticus ferralitis TaxID=236510 RepID=A0ABT5Z3H4_9ACTN|nr:type II secretion system F family protein [Streptantibioticus ferralitis]MDF2258380.1 type II secretion system F family protein [Streptantibioticus ferralitis]